MPRKQTKRSGKSTSKGQKPIRTPEKADNAIVTREFQHTTQLTMAANNTQVYGNVNWGTAMSAHPDFKEMTGLYNQYRVTAVVADYAPTKMLTTAYGFVDVAGVVVHDPTSDVVNSLDPLDYMAMRGAKRYSTAGDATKTGWQRCTYRCPLSNAQNFSTNAQEMSAGTWNGTTHASDMAGQTIFTAQTVSTFINSTIGVILMQVVLRLVVQFREPERTVATVYRLGMQYPAKVLPKDYDSKAQVRPRLPLVRDIRSDGQGGFDYLGPAVKFQKLATVMTKEQMEKNEDYYNVSPLQEEEKTKPVVRSSTPTRRPQ